MSPVDYTAVVGSGAVGHVNRLITRVCNLVDVVTPPDRPKLVCNCYVIDSLVAFVCCHFSLLTFLLV